MGKAENGEIREVTANIWEDRKHHLWFPISFTKYISRKQMNCFLL